MCEQYETFLDRTGQPVVGGQSSSSFVPSVIKTEVLLDSDDRARKELLLQQCGERIEKLSQQDRLSKFVWMQDSWLLLKSDSISWRKTLQNSHNSQMQWLVVSTLCQEMKNHLNRKVGLEHWDWTRIGSCNLLLVRQIWSWDHVHEQRQFSLLGQNFSWLEQVGHEFEQQWAGNLRSAVRRICVEIECEWFCMPIKGQSKTTKREPVDSSTRTTPFGERIWTDVEPGEYSLSVYSLDFGKVCEDLIWNYWTSTPHRSETNGIVERAVRKVKEGTSAVLLQSGPNESWWADSMECYTNLRNVQGSIIWWEDVLWKTFCETISRTDYFMWFIGWVITLKSAKDQSRIHQFGKKVLLGLFLGYAICTRSEFGRMTYWLQTLRISRRWTHRKTFQKEPNAKEVIFPKENGFFQMADGRIKHLGGDQDLKKIHFDAAATNSRRKWYWLSWRIRRVTSTSRLVSGCWWSDTWFLGPCQETSFSVITLNPGSNFIRRVKNISLLLNYVDVSRIVCVDEDVKHVKRIDYCWNVDGLRDLCHFWTGFTKFILLEEEFRGPTWEIGKTVVNIWVKSFWPVFCINMGKIVQQKEKHKWSDQEPKFDDAKDCEDFISLTWRTRICRKGWQFIADCYVVHKFILMLQPWKSPQPKQHWIKNGKIEGVGFDESQK